HLAVVVDDLAARREAVTVVAQVVRADAQSRRSRARARQQVHAQLGGDRPHPLGAAAVVLRAQAGVDQDGEPAGGEATRRVDELVGDRLVPAHRPVLVRAEGQAQAGLRAVVLRFSHPPTLTRVLVHIRRRSPPEPVPPHNGEVSLTHDVLTTPRRWPIRVATTVIATAIVILVLAAAAGGAWLLLRSAVHGAIDSADRARAVDVAGGLAAQGPQASLGLVSEPLSGVDMVRVVAPGGRILAGQVTRGLEDVPALPAPAPGQIIRRDLDAPNGADLRMTSVGVEARGVTLAVDVATDTGRYDTVLVTGAVLFLSFVPVA